METEGSLLCSQEFAIGPCLQPYASISQPSTPFSQDTFYYPLIYS